MTAADLLAALDALGWSQSEAARALAAPNRQRVNAWCHGRRAVPRDVAAHLTTLLAARAVLDGAPLDTLRAHLEPQPPT